MKKHILIPIICLMLAYLTSTHGFSQFGITTYDNFPIPIQYTQTKKDIFIDNHDSIYLVCTSSAGNELNILSFKNGNWNVYYNDNYYISYPTTICKWNNELYVGTQYSGVYNIHTGGQFSTSNTSCMLSNHIYKIRGLGNKLYIATAKGMVVWDGISSTCFNTSNSPIINDTILDFVVRNNKLYLATPNGFYIRSNNTWLSFNSMNVLNTIHYIDAIEVDDGGKVWMTSRQSPTGLLTWDGFSISTEAHRFQDASVYSNFKAIDLINIPGRGIFIPGHLETNPNVLGLNGYCPAIIINSQKIETFCISNYTTSRQFNANPLNSPNGTLLALNSQNNLFFINKKSTYYRGLYQFNPDSYDYLNCGTYDNYKFIDINKLKGAVGAFNKTFPNAYYSLERGLRIKDFYNKYNSIGLSLWIAKINGPIIENLTADRPVSNQDLRDTWPGPLKIDGSASIDIAVAKQFNRVWKVSQADIDNFLFHFNNGSVSSGQYEIPRVILEWPASGPAGYDPLLAPFTDVNNDGIYNPWEGDYPTIKGKQMLYFILNDKLESHQSGGLPLGVEIRVSVYACKNDTATGFNEIINRTIFQEYEIINRTNQAIDSVNFAFLADFDVLHYTANYVGTHVNENAIYGIFSSSSDEPVNDSFNIVQSIQVLNMPPTYNNMENSLNKTMYYDGCGNCALGEPNDVFDYKNYMQGKFKDDQYLHFGGIGYPGANNVTNYKSNFSFPGFSDPTHRSTNGTDPGFIWDEYSAMNSPGDRRILASVKPVKLLPNTPVKFTLGLITTYDSLLNSQALIHQNRIENQVLKSWTYNQTIPCYEPNTASTETIQSSNQLTVFPNPSNGIISIIYDNLNIRDVSITDLQGKLVFTKIVNSKGSQIDLDLQILKSGTYILKITNVSGTPLYRKIIIQ